MERPLVERRQEGGSLRFHLAYPNQYWVAMSNLGFQQVYSIIAALPGVEIDRAFFPEELTKKEQQPNIPNAKVLRTFERDRPLDDCDMLGFSMSFETDFPHVVSMLRTAGLLSLDPAERARQADTAKFPRPLLVAGGTSITLNPEPVADLFDVMVIGEAEEILADLIAAVQLGKKEGLPRVELLKRLATIDGIYVPQFYEVDYQPSGSVLGFRPLTDVPARPRRRFVKDLSQFPTHTRILTPETEFRSMFMTETGRGCEMGCRFCVAGYIYRPVRKRSEESIASTVQLGLKHSDAIGFVGASVSSHRSISKLASTVAQSGARASLSSLMAQKITPQLAESISESEYKTVALAPEAGSERLRRAAGKRVDNQTFIDAVQQLASRGVKGFKLYFIVGLPTEQDEDVEAIADLAIEIRNVAVEASKASGVVAWVQLSVNPFIPKAVTPFQWSPMLDPKTIERRIELVRDRIRKIPNIEIRFETPKEAYFQALLSRGDRRVAQLLVAAEEQGKDWKWIVSQRRKEIIPGIPTLDFYTLRQIPYEETLPWDIVDPRVEKTLLKREALRAHETLLGGDGAPVDGPEGEMTPELLQRALTG
jgi:radical SAM superfamily enzyme YgiQ (UPF0313 family)